MDKVLKTFELRRDEDVSGVSGTGVVVVGAIFPPDGRVVMRWVTGEPPYSIVIYDAIEDVMKIHGHDGKTRLVMND
jgi:hypothetical protein